ncbi:hypothetical protein TREMEDRAFT_44940 [Tremella mesenterica DSM 1558]|uniref:uncharacterized protein n=1 Tax=Tremella mesenterica (strain ATCC 24925 / CBS 8224 / DSM 1558 / NBRC 9311 / NRRL Y-6157 / RJB 2259-6 / UBC 559-6) TaxID=578456 RepID=UPI0003F4A653|nr:uncharacterized protein TREMEDRAFT_44940 [Tremella mesenterica DSM 1558]EIW67935.1 hypothetical protein TREMEDRAFT_44940 [Tremella mesenterica DSM 1558]
MSKPTVLFIFTSADTLLNGAKVGWYLPEAAHPYYALTSSGEIAVDAASPLGGTPPLDQESVKNFTDKESVDFLEKDEVAVKFWKNTKKISDVKAEDYAAIFVVGGHGPLIDLATDQDFKKLCEEFYATEKPVTAVCHGPAALLQVKAPNGDSILKGVNVTGFSDAEEAQTPYADYVNILPFSLEKRLKEESGGRYKCAEPWASEVIWDKGILTGQNPASAKGLGEKLKSLLLKTEMKA